jgi:predicted nucleic acid-binding protein
MAVTAVDANVFIGYGLKRDQYHDRARTIVQGFDEGDLPRGMVTNYVLSEVLNIIGERVGHESGVELLDAIIESAGFEIVHLPKADFTAGQALYRQYHGLNFVDSITVAYMQREGIDYLYSFDDDFDAIDGITRLNTAADPSG